MTTKKMFLEDVAEIKSGCPLSKLQNKVESGEFEFKIAGIKDVKPEEQELECSHIERSFTDDKEMLTKYKLATNDLLITAKGNAIRTTLFRFCDVPVLSHTNLFVITPKNEDVLPEYLALYLNLNAVVDTLKSNLAGTAVLSLTKKDLTKLEVVIPSLSQQKKLVELQKHGRALIGARRKEIEGTETLIQEVLIKNILGVQNV